MSEAAKKAAEEVVAACGGVKASDSVTMSSDEAGVGAPAGECNTSDMDAIDHVKEVLGNGDVVMEPAPAGEGENGEQQQEQQQQQPATAAETSAEMITFTVVFQKKKLPVTFDLDATLDDLRGELMKLTNVPQSMQKLMFKGPLKENSATLRMLKFKEGIKVLLVGSTLGDVAASIMPSGAGDSSGAASSSPDSGTPEVKMFRDEKEHQLVLAKGKPADAMPGARSGDQPLPSHALAGMVTKGNKPVRLTFKLELDQLWISTKERTEKVNVSAVRAVVSEPIDGHEDYCMVGLQLGPTTRSRFWVYWVPRQYVRAMKRALS